MSNIQLHNIHYDTQSGTFAARVDISRGDVTYRYPCSISGPATMDMADVCKSLSQHALNMSDSDPRFTHYS